MAGLEYRGLLRSLLLEALKRPALLPRLAAAAWRFRARYWYRRAPFLPLPPADYIAWRLHTAYGAEDAVPGPRELTRYLRWTAGVGKRGRVR